MGEYSATIEGGCVRENGNVGTTWGNTMQPVSVHCAGSEKPVQELRSPVQAVR